MKGYRDESGYFYVDGKRWHRELSFIFQIRNFQGKGSTLAGSIDLLENYSNSFPEDIKTSALANNKCSQILVQYLHSWKTLGGSTVPLVLAEGF